MQKTCCSVGSGHHHSKQDLVLTMNIYKSFDPIEHNRINTAKDIMRQLVNYIIRSTNDKVFVYASITHKEGKIPDLSQSGSLFRKQLFSLALADVWSSPCFYFERQRGME